MCRADLAGVLLCRRHGEKRLSMPPTIRAHGWRDVENPSLALLVWLEIRSSWHVALLALHVRRNKLKQFKSFHNPLYMGTSGGDRTHDKLIKSQSGIPRIAGFFQSVFRFGTILAELNAEPDAAADLRGSTGAQPHAAAFPASGVVGVPLDAGEVSGFVAGTCGDATV